MYTETFNYTNYMGQQRSKTCHFQLTEAELYELAFSVKGGFIAASERMIENNDEPEMFKNYKNIILLAYGEISADGDRFMKSPEISKAFSETPAFNQLFMRLTSDDAALSEFMKQIVPPKAAENLPEKFDANTLKELMGNADNSNNS